ncbi:hypothetical protein [Rossellomorea aquimaris]|uniref:Uncharacterized protein n=1 Tax=Rossellomorea aquimaris TaxID=189382 RepID=A0A1J6VZQ3_9BACI|nr:hypothetical protein [Rossellomorea aquimaris]OIU69836.1 hypothetical protein BHE18_02700 [Rossellomorea aquimaris]
MYSILFSVVVLSQTTIVSAEESSAKFESDKEGIIAPNDNSDSLSTEQLDNSLLKMGIIPGTVNKMSLEQKREIVKKGGKAFSPSIKKATKVYNSLSGKKIPYTEGNIEKIKKQKIKDIKRYNEQTGKSMSILELPGNNNKLEIVKKEEISDESNSEIIPEENKNQFFATSSIEDQYGVLPPADTVVDGDMILDTQVIYQGPYGAASMEYKYSSYLTWINKPFNTKTDALVTAFDEGAVPIENTFFAQYIQRSATPDGQSLEDVKKLEPDADSFGVYGHGVKFKLGDYQQHSVSMMRSVKVSTSKIGEGAYILTKYRHAYLTVTGIGISIGPGSISFEGANWGDDFFIEYGYDYGNVNPWDV